MVELAYTLGSGPSLVTEVGVQIPLPALSHNPISNLFDIQLPGIISAQQSSLSHYKLRTNENRYSGNNILSLPIF